MAYDVVVVGAGPAGWAVTSGLVQAGVSVCLVAPEPHQPFTNNYGLWMDAVGEWSSPDWYTHIWPSVNVHVSESKVCRLGHRYGRINNHRLRAHFVDQSRGCELVCGRVRMVERHGDRFVAQTEEGQRLHAKLVVDATGHESPLIAHDPGPQPGWQAAYGWTIETPSHPWQNGQAVLMDFRPSDDTHEVFTEPSFLYVLPESTTRVFVEETSLIRRPAQTMDELRRRLKRRLHRLGVTPTRIVSEERCLIPMGGPPAPPVQSVVAFGGAARMVHPASGYMLGRVLTTAPRLVAAIHKSLMDGEDMATRVRRAWSAVWTPEGRKAHNLLRFGAEVLIRMDRNDLSRFFDVFFSIPDHQWFSYLSDGGRPKDIRVSMWSVFAGANWFLKRRLIREAFGPGRDALRQGLLSMPDFLHQRQLV